MITILVAHTKINRVIGKDGTIPWHIPEDLRWFKQQTIGNTIIMGRKTHRSLPTYPNGLPQRQNIVLSKTLANTNPFYNYTIVRSLENALKLATHPIYIIGGAEIYLLTLPICNRIIATEIKKEYKGDTHFPKLGPEWIIDSIIERPLFNRITYLKKAPNGTAHDNLAQPQALVEKQP